MHFKNKHRMKNFPTMNLKDDHILLTQLFSNNFVKVETKQIKQ